MISGAGSTSCTFSSIKGNHGLNRDGFVLVVEALDDASKHMAGTLSIFLFLAPLLEKNTSRFSTVVLLNIFEPQRYVQLVALDRILFV